jgi:hypothetical protein
MPVSGSPGGTSRRCTWASGCHELLEILERSDADRAALIGRLHARDDAEWLAELLIDLEDDVGEIARLRLTEGLRDVLGRARGT